MVCLHTDIPMWSFRIQRLLVVLALHFNVASTQQPGDTGTNVEQAPPMSLKRCTRGGGCMHEPANATLDANWRWIYHPKCTGGQCYSDGNCFTGGAWDQAICENPELCAKNCALGGVSDETYRKTYGVSKINDGVELQFVTGQNIGSRLYLTSSEQSYKMFKLKNREFTFTVDVSGLPCGLNGAVYFVEMDASGGIGGYNKAGAKYGTGYCDAQCPRDVKFMNGKANVLGWTEQSPSGHYGACCTEMDLWEANSASTAYTTHACDINSINGQLFCEGAECSACDRSGCDFNPFRMGGHNFFGAGSEFAVDTLKPVTVVTQFLTSDGTDNGELSEIRRLYAQDGKVIRNSQASVLGSSADDSITDMYCSAQKSAFGEGNDHAAKGGLKAIGDALDRGMVLVMSLWDDQSTKMQWLDSTTGANPSAPGAMRGPCPGDSGSPQELRGNHGSATVRYTDILYGDIGSTFSGVPEPAATLAPVVAPTAPRTQLPTTLPPIPQTSPAPLPAPAPAPTIPNPSSAPDSSSGCAAEYKQCGGKGWAGPTCCKQGCKCTSFGRCVPPNGLATCSVSKLAQRLGSVAQSPGTHLDPNHIDMEAVLEAEHAGVQHAARAHSVAAPEASHNGSGIPSWMYAVFLVNSGLMVAVGYWLCKLKTKRSDPCSPSASAGMVALWQSPSAVQRFLPLQTWDFPSVAQISFPPRLLQLRSDAAIAARSATAALEGIWAAARSPGAIHLQGADPGSPSAARSPADIPLPQSPSAFADKVFAGNRFLPYYSPSGVRRFILNFRSSRGVLAPSSPSKPDEV